MMINLNSNSHQNPHQLPLALSAEAVQDNTKMNSLRKSLPGSQSGLK